MSNNQQADIVQQHIDALMEHFDAVQVLVTSTNESGNTEYFFMGGGNWYARQGMAHDFIRRDKANTDASEIAKVINPPGSGEDWKTD